MTVPSPMMYHMYAILVVGVILTIPPSWMVFLQIHVAVIHEMCHALMVWLTGGDVSSFAVSHFGGGSVIGNGGHHFLSLQAGYLGVIVFGTLLLYITVNHRNVGWVVAASIGWLVGWIVVFHDSMDPYTINIILRMIGISLLLYLTPKQILRVGLFCYIVAIITVGIDNIIDSVLLTAQPSDATYLTRYYGGTRIVWGWSWTVAGLTCVMYSYWYTFVHYQRHINKLTSTPK